MSFEIARPNIAEPGWRYAVSEPAPQDGTVVRVAWYEDTGSPRSESAPWRWAGEGWESWDPGPGVWRRESTWVEYWCPMDDDARARWGLQEDQ